jgi:hypothetical protein
VFLLNQSGNAVAPGQTIPRYINPSLVFMKIPSSRPLLNVS